MSNEIIPFDKRDGKIWMDGKIIEWQDAKVHVLNHGLHYGSSVFEGIRAYNGEIFKLTEHSERLKKSAELLGFEIPYSVKELDEATKLIVKEQNIIDGYIRPVAWRGSEKMAISAQENTIHLAIAAWTWPPYYKFREGGVKLTWAEWKRPSPETAPTAAKAAGLYMICTMSKHLAENTGYHDAMFLDYRGYISEATSANFFMTVNGELHTPIADCFLDGITRRTVIDIAKANNIKVVERHITPEELADADEAFLTGTAAEITPVIEIGEYKFNPGKITNLLKEEYSKLIRK